MFKELIENYFTKLYKIINKELKKILINYYFVIDDVRISDLGERENKFEMSILNVTLRIGHLNEEKTKTLEMPVEELDNDIFISGVIYEQLKNV